MKYLHHTLLLIAVLAFARATQPLPNEANAATVVSNPIEPKIDWKGGRGGRGHKGRGIGKDMAREFEADRFKKKTREFDEKDRFRKRTWERESGSVTSKSRDIHSRTGDLERIHREGRSRVRS